MYPPGHVRLVGEAGFNRNATQRVRSLRYAEPRSARADLCSKNSGRNSIGGGESARDGFTSQAVCFGPGSNLGGSVASQRLS